MHQNTAQTAEQTTEQKAEQNRRTDTNNAERLDEIEIASSGLDPSFLVERPTNTTHFRSVDFAPEKGQSLLGVSQHPSLWNFELPERVWTWMEDSFWKCEVETSFRFELCTRGEPSESTLD